MSEDQLQQLLGWKFDAFHVALAIAVIGRIWRHAGGAGGIWSTLTTRGGLVGVIKTLLFGTNQPK
jgi:hypothetical protein